MNFDDNFDDYESADDMSTNHTGNSGWLTDPLLDGNVKLKFNATTVQNARAKLKKKEKKLLFVRQLEIHLLLQLLTLQEQG